MTKYLIASIAALTLALAALGFAYRAEVRRVGEVQAELNTAKEALNGVAKQRKQDAATVAAWQRQNAATGRKLAQAQQALSEALQAEKGWSDTSVPTEVQKALLRDSERSDNDAN